MLSNEIFARMDLRIRQIFNAFATAWAGLAIRLSGDFHQLPPVAASCLIRPESTTPGNANLTETQTQIAIGRDLWKNIDAVCILEHSHRCQGPLHTFLNDLTSDKGISTDSWQHLLACQLASNDRRLQLSKFHPSRCPIGVLRHSVRALKTVQRAHEAAATCGHRLLLSIAADRCSSANCLFSLASDLALEAASIHTLSTTANLPNILALLYPGIELCLEAKLSAEIGVVRGCTCIVEDIILSDAEPYLISTQYFFYFQAMANKINSPYHPFNFCPRAPFHFYSSPVASNIPNARTFLPSCLTPWCHIITQVFSTWLHLTTASVTAWWVKHAGLGPGRFFLGPLTRPWRFFPRQPSGDNFLLDQDSKPFLQLQRCQLPLTNTFAMTAYQLQGQTLPAIILDLAKPPQMTAVAYHM